MTAGTPAGPEAPGRPGPRLIIVCGLPGSGKTRLATTLETRLGAVRLNADEWMDALGMNLWDEATRAKVEALQWRVGRGLLARGLTVIVEWGTWGRAERDALRVDARALGAAVELRYLTADPDTLYERIRRRNMEDPPIRREQVAGWHATIQAPDAAEMALFDPPALPS